MRYFTQIKILSPCLFPTQKMLTNSTLDSVCSIFTIIVVDFAFYGVHNFEIRDIAFCTESKCYINVFNNCNSLWHIVMKITSLVVTTKMSVYHWIGLSTFYLIMTFDNASISTELNWAVSLSHFFLLFGAHSLINNYMHKWLQNDNRKWWR